MAKTARGSIYYAEKQSNGWIVIRGVIGPRRYLYYSMREAQRRYRKEVLEKKLCFGNTVIYLNEDLWKNDMTSYPRNLST